ncbi:MAG TPA: ankyrin repeat domain-containing protein [Stellaceae bacterium]|nr:ankyrin repeat domain-containing protein [Stellaceae bacterium]
MTRCRAAFLAVVLLACLPAPGALAQSSNATPFNDTSVGGGLGSSGLGGMPAIPFGGLGADRPNNIATVSKSNNAGQVLWYVGQGFDPDQPDYDGYTALMYAAINNNVQIAYILLSHSTAHLDVRDKFGNTALHLAAQRGSLDVMRQLLDAKAPIDMQNRQGITPLMMAANNGRTEAVKLLLKYGADTSKQDYTGRDALGWAGNKAAVVQLLKNPASAH